MGTLRSLMLAFWSHTVRNKNCFSFESSRTPCERKMLYYFGEYTEGDLSPDLSAFSSLNIPALQLMKWCKLSRLLHSPTPLKVLIKGEFCYSSVSVLYPFFTKNILPLVLILENLDSYHMRSRDCGIRGPECEYASVLNH